MPPPPAAALSWLRRRGPPLPEAALHKLFRQENIRLYDPAAQRVGRVAKGRALPPGAMLLLPKAAVAAAGQQAADSGSGQQQQRPLSPAAARVREQAAATLRASLLHTDSDFLALNKPAGLATQGGRNVAVSVDCLMGEAFGGLPGINPKDLRLVHRLDRHTTGRCCCVGGCSLPLWVA